MSCFARKHQHRTDSLSDPPPPLGRAGDRVREQLFRRGHAGAFVGLRPDQLRDLLEFARFTEMARGTYPHDEFNDKKQKLVEGFKAAANITEGSAK